MAAEAAEDAKDNASLLKNAKQLVDDYPDSSRAHYILGVAYGKMNFFDDAAASFQQAIKLKPNNTDAWGDLAKAYLALHEDEKAGEAAREMKRIDPVKAEQLADELSREEPKPVAEAPRSDVP